MRLLILGGTAWLGRHLVMAAQAEGHEVACLARGESGAVPSGAALIRADRNLPNAYAAAVSQRWIVGSACSDLAGTFNAVGEPITLHEHLQRARAVAGFGGQSVAADPDWLSAQGVAPWSGPKSLPLWLPMQGHAGFGARDGRRAVQAGLQRRPLAQTLADLLAWERSRQPPLAARKAGLSDAEEGDLLQALQHASQPINPAMRGRPRRGASGRAGFKAQVLPLFVAGRIPPRIDSVFEFEQLAQALGRMQSHQHLGRIVPAGVKA